MVERKQEHQSNFTHKIKKMKQPIAIASSCRPVARGVLYCSRCGRNPSQIKGPQFYQKGSLFCLKKPQICQKGPLFC